VIIAFELTGDYNVIPPLMFAIVVATALSNMITRDTIYTLKLRRRMIDGEATRSTNLTRQITVSDPMGRTPRALTPEQPLTDRIDRFAAERTDSLPVIARDHKLIGVVAAGDVEQAIAREAETRVLRQRSRAKLPVLRARESPKSAIVALGATDDEGVAVLCDHGHVVGRLSHRQRLRTDSDSTRKTRRLTAPAAVSGGDDQRDSPVRNRAAGRDNGGRDAAHAEGAVTVRPLELDPDLGARIDPELPPAAVSRAVAGVLTVDRGPWRFPPRDNLGLGAVILQGLIPVRVEFAGIRARVELCGEGDTISPWHGMGPQPTARCLVTERVISASGFPCSTAAHPARRPLAGNPQRGDAAAPRRVADAEHAVRDQLPPRVEERLEITLWQFACRFTGRDHAAHAAHPLTAGRDRLRATAVGQDRDRSFARSRRHCAHRPPPLAPPRQAAVVPEPRRRRCHRRLTATVATVRAPPSRRR
jgi:CBS domain-containing protein